MGSEYVPGAALEIKISGEALEAVETLRRISGEDNLLSLILKSVYLYREILAEQALVAVISSDTQYLVPLVEDKRLALDFIARAKMLSFGQDWHLFFVPHKRDQQ